MTIIDEHGRTEPPDAGNEVDTLLGFLDYQRATLEWKTSELDAAGLRATLGPSTMTLGGVLKHMAWVEDTWFSVRLLGNPPADFWADADWTANSDWEWTSSAKDSPDELHALWHECVAHSREVTTHIVAGEGLDHPLAAPRRDGRRPTLRWVLVHMIEEYARHNGHADLLRESVDGQVGE